MEYLLLRSCKLCFLQFSRLHTSHTMNGTRQTGNAMRKVLGATRKKKAYYADSPKLLSPELFTKGSFEGKKTGDSRRSSVLNKLFMRHITDQMATGVCSSELLGHGIEINKVKITPDYKVVRVYWIAKGTKDDEVIESILQKSSGILRHELSQLRIMGIVPMIQFIKDKDYARIVELDNRIAIADFGEDYIPLDSAEKLRTEFTILSPLETNIKEKLKKLEYEENDEWEGLPLPPMPQNVLGLNHAEILEKVKRGMKKSKAPHRQIGVENKEENWVTFKLSQPLNEDPVDLGSNKSQRAVFKEFLHKRNLLRLKANQGKKNEIPDLELLREELRDRQENHLNYFDIIENTIEDFIIEDVDEEFK